MVAKGSEPPEFPLKATDRLAIKAIDDYRRQLLAHGLRSQAEEVLKAIEEFSQWQAANWGQVKLPDHTHVPQSDTVPRTGFVTWDDAIRRLRLIPANATPMRAAEMLMNLATQKTETPPGGQYIVHQDGTACEPGGPCTEPGILQQAYHDGAPDIDDD